MSTQRDIKPRDLQPQARTEVVVALCCSIALVVIGLLILVSVHHGFAWFFLAALVVAVTGFVYDEVRGPKPR